MAEFSGDDRSGRSSALSLGETAPNPIWFSDLEGICPAIADHGTNLAHRLGANLSPLTLILAFLCARRKKEMGVVAAAQGDGLPGTIE
jgi:hypothetical protein